MKILFIAQTDPRNPKTGGAVRTALIWAALKQIGDVYTVIPRTRGRMNLSTAERDEMADERIFLAKPVPLGWARQKIEWLSGGLLKVGALPVRTRDEAFKALGVPDGTAFDCVVVRYVPLASHYSAWKIAPLYIDADDIPSEAFEHLEKYRLPLVLRPFAACLVRAWERAVLRRAAGLWGTNARDVAYLRRFAKAKELRNIATPVGRDFQLTGRQEKLFLVVGYLGYGPNAEGLDWFLMDVWPAAHRKFPDYRLAIAGGGLSVERQKLWSSIAGVDLLGFVSNLDSAYERSVGVVAPILSGVGTCVKTIEACLRGRKTFVTPCAARGLSVEDRWRLGLVQFEDADGFVAAVEEWLLTPFEERGAEQLRLQSAAQVVGSFDGFATAIKGMIA